MGLSSFGFSWSSLGITGGHPYCFNSISSFFAAPHIGYPVTWKAKGNKVLYPFMRWYPAANSVLDTVNKWPKCRRPFIYGYGKVVKNFFLSSPFL